MVGKKTLRVFKIALFIIPVFLFAVIAPAEENEFNPHFYFVQITDTHWGDFDHFDRTQKVVNMINALPMPIKCVVHTGDITMDKLEDESVVQDGIKILGALKAPVHFTPGNHDILRQRYDATQKVYAKYFGSLITEAEYDGIVFLMVYTEPLTQFFPVETFKPLTELAGALKRSKGKPVIVFHHSPSVGDFYNNVMHYRWPDEIREKWVALLNSYNVKAVIAGHFHRDEHHWIGNIPLYVSSSIGGYWGRQATFRIYEYKDGKIGYRTQYVEP